MNGTDGSEKDPWGRRRDIPEVPLLSKIKYKIIKITKLIFLKYHL